MTDSWRSAPLVQAAPSAATPQRRQAAPRPQIRFADDTDALARTLIGEAGNQGETGMLAVGGVVANRARNRNMTPTQVVLERNQFEPWGNPATARRLMSISPQSPEYQSAYAIAQRALAGEDPTGGADHFYAPKAQAALGRRPPSWATGTPTVIGDHNFYNLGGSTEDVRMTAASMPSGGGSWMDAPVVGQAEEPIAVEIDQGVLERNGRVYDADGQDLGTVSEWEASKRQSQSDRLARAEREADPMYQAAIARARGGSEAVPERLRAILQGQSYGLGDEILGGVEYALQGLENAGRQVAGQPIEISAAMASQAARDSERDAQAAYAAENPVENFALQLAGGIVAPGAIQAGNYIARGGQAARTAAQASGATGRALATAGNSARTARAAQVGTGMGLASGFGYGEGDLVERAPDAALSAVIGGATGAGAQMGLNRLGRAGEGGGAARRLSRQGVNLTPGQMVSETPVVGEFVRNIEDVAGGFNPLMIGVRRRQNEQVVRAAGNEALGYIGERLPRDARTGYQVSQNVRRALGDRYDDVTSRITAQADPEIYTDLSDLTSRAAQTLDDGNLRRLERILNDKFINEFDAGGGLSGANFKRIETALREQSERASRPTSTLADNDLAEFLDEARDIARNLIARQHPEEAAAIQNLNRGWATNKIIERAVTGSAGFSRSGTPTPGEVSQAVVNSSNLGAIANENALLQGLATDARTVLPSTVPDSGTAQKTALAATAGAIGAGGATAISPGLAPLIAAGAVVYSRPGIALLNAVYRATDSRAANASLRQLADQARRNPSLVPYYEDAVQHVLSLSQRDRPATSQAPTSTPVPTPVQ